MSPCPGWDWPCGVQAHRLVSCPLIRGTDPYPKGFVYIFNYTANSVARARKMFRIQSMMQMDKVFEGLKSPIYFQIFTLPFVAVMHPAKTLIVY